MRSKPSLSDISYKLDDLSSLMENLAALSCQECEADLDVNENDVYCSDCVQADRDQIEELKKENEELREKLERADWSDKMDLLHEWAWDYDHALKTNQEREFWYEKYNALFSRLATLKAKWDNILLD